MLFAALLAAPFLVVSPLTPAAAPTGCDGKHHQVEEPSGRSRGQSEDRSKDPRARQQRDAWRTKFGTTNYRYAEDPKHRLVFATCLDEASHKEMQRMLEAQADQQSATLFDAPPEVEVFVAIARPADAKAVIGADRTSEGMYEHPLRRLVASDIGIVLRHEFTHLMHFGHMERLGQPHPMWVQEGIACLYENYELGADGSIVFPPNLRHNQARAMASARTFMPFAKLVALGPDDFMQRSQNLYPQTRSMFEFIADQGKLRKWYRRFTETFNEDRTGVRALEEVFGMPLAKIENEWRTWVLKRPAIATTAVQDIRDMGVEVTGVTDGVRLKTVQNRGSAARAGLKVGDVITAIDGTVIRSPREFLSAIGAAKGDRIVVTVRRNGATSDVEVRFSGANNSPRAAVTNSVSPADVGWPGIRRIDAFAGLSFIQH